MPSLTVLVRFAYCLWHISSRASTLKVANIIKCSTKGWTHTVGWSLLATAEAEKLKWTGFATYDHFLVNCPLFNVLLLWLFSQTNEYRKKFPRTFRSCNAQKLQFVSLQMKKTWDKWKGRVNKGHIYMMSTLFILHWTPSSLQWGPAGSVILNICDDIKDVFFVWFLVFSLWILSF